MLFTKTPLCTQDILTFCERFAEGLRVEYKANLDDSVRKILPKVISSFAKSHGGVLILGVTALKGAESTSGE